VGGVVPIAERHIMAAGVADRVKTRVGDLRDNDYGSGCDLVFISAICHMLSPDENRTMLRKALAALEPGGRVVIQDFILDPDKTGPKTGALFALNMVVGTRAGSSYSEEEYTERLRDSGFREIRRVRLPGPTDLVIAQRPWPDEHSSLSGRTLLSRTVAGSGPAGPFFSPGGERPGPPLSCRDQQVTSHRPCRVIAQRSSRCVAPLCTAFRSFRVRGRTEP
jgi:hypothetical protein